MKDEIIRLYLEEGLSVRAVGGIIGKSHGYVSKILKENDIEIRSKYTKEYYTYRKYKKANTRKDSCGYIACKDRLHRVLYSKYHNIELTEEMHIHHIDFDKTNNAIENLFLFETGKTHLLYHGYIKTHEYLSPSEFISTIYPKLKETLLNYEWLYEHYIVKHTSCNKISISLGVSRNTVTSQLKSFGIFYMREPSTSQFD